MIAKMKFVNITGPKGDIDRMTQKYLLRYPIHLENALSELGDSHTLTPFIEENPYKETVAILKDMAQLVNHGDPDTLTVSSPERILMAKEDGIIFSDVSRTAWSEFAKLAQYFPENYYSGGADTVTEFEMQLSPMLISGSWNVGLILDDMNMMPEDSRFEWATFKVPGFANPPEGFQSEMRGMYVLGNIMGIIPKGDPDHDARVLDFYLYWYSQAGAQLCYEETLANGNYVQGPCMIKGVTLSDELNEKLEGFVTSGPVKQYSSEIIGMSQATQADMPLYNDLQNRFIAGEIDLDTFLEELNGIMHNYTVSQMEASGYDLDPLT